MKIGDDDGAVVGGAVWRRDWLAQSRRGSMGKKMAAREVARWDAAATKETRRRRPGGDDAVPPEATRLAGRGGPTQRRPAPR